MSMINDALKRVQKKSPSTAPGPQLRPAEPLQFGNRTLSLTGPVLLIFAMSIGVFFLWQAFQNPAGNPEPVKAKTIVAENPVPVAPKTIVPTIPEPKVVQQPIQKIPQLPAQKPIQQPVQKVEVAQQPVQKVVQQPIQTVVQQPVQPPVQKTVQQPVKPVQMAAMSVPQPKTVTPKPAPVAAPASTPAPTSAPVAAPTPAPEKTPAPVSAPASAPAPEPEPVVVGPAPTSIKLQAIFYAPGHSTAIINGKMMGVGDKYFEFRVTAITTTSVTLVSGTWTNMLALGGQ